MVKERGDGNWVRRLAMPRPSVPNFLKRAKVHPAAKSKSAESESMTNEEVIRETDFIFNTRSNQPYKVTLTKSTIHCEPLNQDASSGTERLSLNNLFGVQTYRTSTNKVIKVKKGGSQKRDEEAAYLVLTFYPTVKKGIWGKSISREKTILIFSYSEKADDGTSKGPFENNLKVVSEWKHELMTLLREDFSNWQKERLMNFDSAAMHANGHGDCEAYEELLESTHALRISVSSQTLLLRRFVVILNPKSGQGKTLQLFKEVVHPILAESGIRTELLVTERPGHARSMVSSVELNDVHAFVTVGGDGLLYEVVNGLRSRADASNYTDIPVGVIAGGSGNGLARSIAAYSGESGEYLKNPVLVSTLAVARGKVLPVNLMEVEVDSRKVFAFLSVGWGILADIDIESEVIRGVGESRFTLWSLLRIARLRTYNAIVKYGLNGNKGKGEGVGEGGEGEGGTETVDVSGNFVSVYASCQSHIGSDIYFAPKAKPNDGSIHLTFIRGNVGRARVTQFLLGLDTGSHVDVPGVEYVEASEFSIEGKGGIGGTLTLDGERVKGELIRAKLAEKPLNVFAL